MKNPKRTPKLKITLVSRRINHKRTNKIVIIIIGEKMEMEVIPLVAIMTDISKVIPLKSNLFKDLALNLKNLKINRHPKEIKVTRVYNLNNNKKLIAQLEKIIIDSQHIIIENMMMWGWIYITNTLRICQDIHIMVMRGIIINAVGLQIEIIINRTNSEIWIIKFETDQGAEIIQTIQDKANTKKIILENKLPLEVDIINLETDQGVEIIQTIQDRTNTKIIIDIVTLELEIILKNILLGHPTIIVIIVGIIHINNAITIVQGVINHFSIKVTITECNNIIETIKNFKNNSDRIIIRITINNKDDQKITDVFSLLIEDITPDQSHHI